jgi:hypothetical protein
MNGTVMTRDQPAAIYPRKRSTDDVGEFVRNVENIVGITKGAGARALEPNEDLRRQAARDIDTSKGHGA